MATYIIGDLQGCYDELLKLLDHIHYNQKKDELWFVGDIVNRGPKSLECLRFVKNLGKKGKMVLGNHDIHLLAAYTGIKRYQSKKDTLQPILEAKDKDELINWLRCQPLLISHNHLPVVMVHAGIPPQWSIDKAKKHAKEVEIILQADNWQTAIRDHLFGNDPKEWQDSLESWDKLRYIVNAFTRMRLCNKKGTLEFNHKSSVKNLNTEYQPWFNFPQRKNKNHEIFFGHWSTLGEIDNYNVHSTDTGCLWGGHLTAYCLETQQRHFIDCNQKIKPKNT